MYLTDKYRIPSMVKYLENKVQQSLQWDTVTDFIEFHN